MERLQKIIAGSGICSRRRAEELILEGKVAVNGRIITELGFKADPEDEITVEGRPVRKEEKVVYLLNKPKNVISSVSDDKGRKTVVDLIDSPYRIFPIGRLDFDSSGLLLLSNDGELMQKIIHPKYEVEKTYEVTIDGLIRQDEIEQLCKGVIVDDYITSPAQVKLIRKNENRYTSFLEVTIHEGKNREIRKMFESIGYTVIKLHRISEAGIELGNLKSGEYRLLKPYEIKKLKQYLNNADR
ncbi:MAG: rRNA pseudouridine synthase [Erysipelotrichaceae bacterium]|nr:rRNA pseudouridine synthase [Erysipelotrichaceae bacterium]MBQ1534028.1 rRNA pseudouridine synthase [Erysipelotrichaceae bacterium]